MKPNRTILLTVLCLVFASALTLAACTTTVRNEKSIDSVTVSNLPDGAIIIGEFDSAGITLNLNYSDGETDVIPVTESMFPEAYKGLLHVAGTHDVEVLYRGKTAAFTVTMRERYQWAVVFINALGQTVKTQTISEGDSGEIVYPTAEEMAVEGYRFTGFPQVATPVTESITIAGEYVKTWVVTFYNGNNETISVQTVDDGSAATEPSEEARAVAGYEFVSWDVPFDNIAKDTDVYGFYVKVSEPEIPSGDVYTREGEYIYFGTYPQTKVDESAVTAALNSAAGALPTSFSSGNWTSYGYYISGSNTTDYMWYIDVTYGGEKYRGVYFTSYRPYFMNDSSSASSSYQDDNGYNANSAYWFRYEPVKWRILEEANGEALLFCEMIIDSQEYYHENRSASFNHNGGSGYANNYALSNIRKWLNETFYNTAFTELEKSIIQLVTVDNGARSTNPNGNATQFNGGTNQYACENTQDHIFLLSEQEVTNTAYGFSGSYSNGDAARQKKTTDYAKAQGAYTYSGGEYDGNGYWWLRSPYYYYSNRARYVNLDGFTDTADYVYSTGNGVVPALKITL